MVAELRSPNALRCVGPEPTSGTASLGAAPRTQSPSASRARSWVRESQRLVLPPGGISALPNVVVIQRHFNIKQIK